MSFSPFDNRVKCVLLILSVLLPGVLLFAALAFLRTRSVHILAGNPCRRFLPGAARGLRQGDGRSQARLGAYPRGGRGCSSCADRLTEWRFSIIAPSCPMPASYGHLLWQTAFLKKSENTPLRWGSGCGIIFARSPERAAAIFENWTLDIKENCNVYRDKEFF